MFDLRHTVASDYLSQFSYPWEALSGIKFFIIKYGAELDEKKYNQLKPLVWVHRDTKIAPTAYIDAPCIIGRGSEVRHCAFIRGNALIGENCVVGNSTEIKNSIIFDGVQIPHFNYVGDSILGYKTHMGAGAITSNVKSDKSPVTVNADDGKIQSGLKKFGAIICDFVEIGCNSVLNPGTVIGKNTTVYPLSNVRGVIPQNSIYKNSGTIIKKTGFL